MSLTGLLQNRISLSNNRHVLIPFTLRSYINLILIGMVLALTVPLTMNGWAEEEIAVVPYPGDVEPDLWLFGGQSNMAGYAHIVEEIEPDPRVLFFSNAKEWVVMKNPVEPLFFPHGDPHGCRRSLSGRRWTRKGESTGVSQPGFSGLGEVARHGLAAVKSLGSTALVLKTTQG